jgi:hypothetical protein
MKPIQRMSDKTITPNYDGETLSSRKASREQYKKEHPPTKPKEPNWFVKWWFKLLHKINIYHYCKYGTQLFERTDTKTKQRKFKLEKCD